MQYTNLYYLTETTPRLHALMLEMGQLFDTGTV